MVGASSLPVGAVGESTPQAARSTRARALALRSTGLGEETSAKEKDFTRLWRPARLMWGPGDIGARPDDFAVAERHVGWCGARRKQPGQELHPRPPAQITWQRLSGVASPQRTSRTDETIGRTSTRRAPRKCGPTGFESLFWARSELALRPRQRAAPASALAPPSA